MRPLQLFLKDVRTSVMGVSQRFSVPPACREAILWWLEPQRLMEGISLMQHCPSVYMETDASMKGWGAHVQTLVASGSWSAEEKLLHINCLEIRAVLNALKVFWKEVQGQAVALLGDNVKALAYLSHGGGTRSTMCHLEAQKVLLWAEEHQVKLFPRFIPGARNVIADSLSRREETPAAEWCLNMEICRRLWSLWGLPQIDAFATKANKRLPEFFSPLPDQQARGIDAFLQDWSNLFLYLYPPTKTIRKVLTKFLQSKGNRGILIAPCWPQQAWFPDLLHLLSEHPRSLPPWPNLLTQTVGGRNCPHVSFMNLHAWKLSNISWEREEFLDNRLNSWQSIQEPPLGLSTRRNGLVTKIGVVNGRSILSIPLSQT